MLNFLAAGADAVLDHLALVKLFLAVAVLLGMARFLGEIARRLKQPTIIGEILAGILLGPTVLGLLAPEVYTWIFPGWATGETGTISDGAVYTAMKALIAISAAMMLLVAGLEVDLSAVWRQGRATLLVSAFGIALPLAVGGSVCYFAPQLMLDLAGDDPRRLPAALFVGIALSITALPVIAKILMDLNLLKSDLGMLVMSSAMVNDLVGWLLFAVVLALMPAPAAMERLEETEHLAGASAVVQPLAAPDDAASSALDNAPPQTVPTAGIDPAAEPAVDNTLDPDSAAVSSTPETPALPRPPPDEEKSNGATDVLFTLVLTLLFVGAMLTLGRLACHRVLPYLQAHRSWPGTVIAFVLVVALACAAATEIIGIHSIFGAFIAGVAIGDSHHLRERTRETIQEFITNIFAPLFFASIGLGVNFIAAFNPLLVVVVLVMAAIGKIGGCYLGGRVAKMGSQESWAVAFGMVAQGTMGVILGDLAFSAGLIEEPMFVAIICMALVTSLISGPAMQRILRPAQQRAFADLVTEKQFVDIEARSLPDALRELSARAASIAKREDADAIYRAVWERERIMHTGLGNGLAVPHARMDDLKKPIVVIGRSRHGVDFDSPDGQPARLMCLLLTPADDPTVQIELLSLFATAFEDTHSREAALSARNFTEFLAAVRLPGEADKSATTSAPSG